MLRETNKNNTQRKAQGGLQARGKKGARASLFFLVRSLARSRAASRPLITKQAVIKRPAKSTGHSSGLRRRTRLWSTASAAGRRALVVDARGDAHAKAVKGGWK